MVAIAVIAVSVVAMGVIYTIASNRSYERALKAKKEKELQDAKDELARALKEHPQDVLLHATIYDRIKRMRNQ